METIIINGVPTVVLETKEEITEALFPEKDREIFLIEKRLDEIAYDQVTAEDVKDEYTGAAAWASDLKKEQAELRERLRVLNA